MAHVYQPVMLIELLSNQGKSSIESIAQSILSRDPTQVEYYIQVVKNMVGRVLTKNRGITRKEGDSFLLNDAGELSLEETDELIQLCLSRLEEYEEKRGNTMWEHRRRGHRPISGSIRYKVLKRASGLCEACGVSNTEKKLEVDHIHPKSLGGKDDISNYQALCYSCNAAKRNTDDTDFRDFKTMYEHRQDGCLFCHVSKGRKITAENSLAYAIEDGFPVTEMHTLVIPKRHVADYFELTQAEVNAVTALMNELKESIQVKDKSVTGFNIGMNCGESAGQTIFHCHTHLIPRRDSDVENPRGGVRHSVIGKGYY